MTRPHLPIQFFTLIMGVLLLLPLQALSLPLLLSLPGLSVFLLYKGAQKKDIFETIAYSLTLSLVLVPVAAMIVDFIGVGIATTGLAIGSAVIITSVVSFAVEKKGAKSSEVESSTAPRHQKRLFLALPIVLALALALVVSVPLSKSFVVGDEGLMMNPTDASDLNFHLSIVARFVEAPHIPPEDPYLPGHYIVYDFFTHVYLGTLSIITNISPLTIFKIVIPLLFFTLATNVFVLCRRAFDSETALIAMLIYTLGGGLAWIIIAVQQPADVFQYLIYNFSNVAAIKYDQTVLYYLLPQPQTFALVILVFAFILWITLIKKMTLHNALLFGFVLGILPYYHLITAFPLFVAVAAYVVWQYVKREVRSAHFHLGALAVGAALATPLILLLAGSPSQVEITFSTYSLLFLLIVYGLIGILACIGAFRSLRNEASQPLLLFALCAFVAVNILALPLTDNSYRFLVYLWLPVAIFASYCASNVLTKTSSKRFWSRKKVLQVLAVAAALFLALPTSYLLWDFYNSATYALASPDEVQAMQWINTNTSKDAIFLEEPSTFPRIPLETGRRVAFAGELYAIQYFGVDLQQQINALMSERNPQQLSLGLQQYNVTYVFVGSREQQYAIANTLKDTRYFEIVYSNPGVTIYKLKSN